MSQSPNKQIFGVGSAHNRTTYLNKSTCYSRSMWIFSEFIHSCIKKWRACVVPQINAHMCDILGHKMWHFTHFLGFIHKQGFLIKICNHSKLKCPNDFVSREVH